MHEEYRVLKTKIGKKAWKISEKDSIFWFSAELTEAKF